MAIKMLCNRGVTLNLKGKFFRATIRPALIYRSKYRAFRKDHSRLMGVAEM